MSRLHVAALRRHLPDSTVVDPVLDQLADGIRAIRRVVDGLQPSVLEDVGLVPALQILLADIRSASGVNITLDAPPTLPELSMVAASTAYRVVAEALANVVRHSGAIACRVCLTHTDGMLHVEIVDNGRGFEPAAVSGMGLRSMSERATMAHGTMRVVSSATSGTHVALEVPA